MGLRANLSAVPKSPLQAGKGDAAGAGLSFTSLAGRGNSFAATEFGTGVAETRAAGSSGFSASRTLISVTPCALIGSTVTGAVLHCFSPIAAGDTDGSASVTRGWSAPAPLVNSFACGDQRARVDAASCF